MGYGIAVIVLVAQGRTPGALLPTAIVDLVLAVLFALAFVRTRDARLTIA